MTPTWARQVEGIMRGGTRLDTSRPNDLRRIQGLARVLGLTLLPWQKYVAATATEKDQAGVYAYDTVVISTPRQCGKSALVDIMDIYNASLGPDRRIIYSAQTGKDSEDHFKELAKRIQASRLRQIVRGIRYGNGAMRCEFTNGSTIQPMAMTKVAGHGRQLDKVTIDEAFSLSAEEGATIDDAILPTMTTRLKATGIQPQRWITSTEGTSESTYFNTLIDSLRAGTRTAPRTAWFDFGVPDDADPTDLDAILATHPAAGYLWDRTQLTDFREGFGTDTAGFARAYGNRRDIGSPESFIPADLWDSTACQPIDPSTAAGHVTFAAAVDIDSTHTSIAAAIGSATGTVVQICDILHGTGTAPARLAQLAARYKAPIVVDRRGPGAPLADRLLRMAEDGSITVTPIPGDQYMAAGQAFVDSLSLGTMTHATDTDLDRSASTSSRTWSGDAWRITRRGSAGITSPLEACILAAWGAGHTHTPPLDLY